MIAKGGLTPNAYLLLCAWHLTDRAIEAKFRGAKGTWSDSLYQCFWTWQRCETIHHFNLVYEWFKNEWFFADIVQANMPAQARDGAMELIDNLHMRRKHWALCCNIDVAAHDTRVNTFVEVQNHVLMDHVHVHPSMTMQTMVFKEDLVQGRKDRRLAHMNFRTLSTNVSIMKNKSTSLIATVCKEMQNVTTPKMGKIMTNQVQVAASCLNDMNSTWHLCTNRNCKVCEEYMTEPQKLALLQGKTLLAFHVKMRSGDADACNTKPSSLGEAWDALHATIPGMKHPRIVTAENLGNGKFLFICSCGFGFRYQCTCRHVAMIILHASGSACAGNEIENMALRNTAAYAACRDASLIKRSANDWKGTVCSHVTEDSLRICPGGDHDDDGNDNDRDDQRDDRNDGDQVQKRPRRSAEWQRLKSERDAKIQTLQDHFYRIKAKLEIAASHQVAEFWMLAEGVDGHLHKAFEGLNGVPELGQSVVAHRYRDDAMRRQPARGAGGGHPARATAGGSARTSTSAPAGGGAAKRTAPLPAARTAAQNEVVTRSSGASDNSASAPQHPPQRPTRMYLTGDGGAWYIDSQPERQPAAASMYADLQTLLNGGAPSDSDSD